MNFTEFAAAKDKYELRASEILDVFVQERVIFEQLSSDNVFFEDFGALEDGRVIIYALANNCGEKEARFISVPITLMDQNDLIAVRAEAELQRAAMELSNAIGAQEREREALDQALEQMRQQFPNFDITIMPKAKAD